VLLIMPVFAWLVASHSLVALIGGLALVAVFSSASAAAFYPAICESLPKRIRGRAFGTVYATAIAVFGGTTQLVLTWLIHVTGDPMAPGWYWFGSAVVSLFAMTLIIESAPVRAAPAPAAQPA
jgi:MFS family permease